MQTTFVCDLKSDLNWVFEIMHHMNNALVIHRQTVKTSRHMNIWIFLTKDWALIYREDYP